LNQFTIKNKFIALTILDYGAIIQKIIVKNRKGKETNVVVGLENPINYLHDTISLGACIGRYAGRISGGGFDLNGKTYTIHTENGIHLHGGKQGFSKKYWSLEQIGHGKEPFIKLSYLSDHMEEGYPGNLKVYVTYKLISNSLQIIHEAITDSTTVLNMTNHSYFRLDNEESIDHYNLQLNCPMLLETQDNLLPTGRIVSVNNGKFDFLSKKKIGSVRLDTPFVIAHDSKEVAHVYSKKSGILMRIRSNQPAVVVYTPVSFPSICFETQNYPDAPNNPSFPSSRLEPGETYNNTTIFEFDLVI